MAIPEKKRQEDEEGKRIGGEMGDVPVQERAKENSPQAGGFTRTNAEGSEMQFEGNFRTLDESEQEDEATRGLDRLSE